MNLYLEKPTFSRYIQYIQIVYTVYAGSNEHKTRKSLKF